MANSRNIRKLLPPKTPVMMVTIGGKRTSLRLELEFIEGLSFLSEKAGVSLNYAVREIAAEQPNNLHSALLADVMKRIMQLERHYASAVKEHEQSNGKDIIFDQRRLFKACDRNGPIFMRDVLVGAREVRISLELPFWVALWLRHKETKLPLEELITEASGEGLNRSRHSDIRSYLVRSFMPANK